MKVEILYPDLINLYGETGNIKLLKSIFKDQCLETSINEMPKFITQPIDLIYIGASSEQNQLLVLQELLKYRAQFKEYIENDGLVFASGNGLELFGKYIKFNDCVYQALDIFNYYTISSYEKRYNSAILGVDQDGLEIVAFKTTFSQLYDIPTSACLFKVLKGLGNNIDQKYDGFVYKSFYGTNTIGPFLVMNPLFLVKLLQLKNCHLEIKHLDLMIKAYKQRLMEFKDPKTKL